jgi:predicted metal-binding membrane protein
MEANAPAGAVTRRDLAAALVRRDGWIVGVSLALLAGLCWAYLAIVAGAMNAMTDAGGSTQFMWLMPMGRWNLADFGLAALMWIVMMIGMMVPSAAPMILLYAAIRRREAGAGNVLPPTALFLTGYLAVWTGFSLAAAALQFGLVEARLMSDLMESESAALGAGILIAAGVYQLSPWKRACLAHCRSPIAFLLHHWRPGAVGALRMGLSHGAYCLGCCWLVMCVLFALGVMNLAWVAGISILVLAEKITRFGAAIARIAGALLIGAGVLILAGAL